jgi:hypothetical protein
VFTCEIKALGTKTFEKILKNTKKLFSKNVSGHTSWNRNERVGRFASSLSPSSDFNNLAQAQKSRCKPSGSMQGCRMAYFLTTNPNLGKVLSALLWKMWVYFIVIWSIL